MVYRVSAVEGEQGDRGTDYVDRYHVLPNSPISTVMLQRMLAITELQRTRDAQTRCKGRWQLQRTLAAAEGARSYRGRFNATEEAGCCRGR